MRIAIIGSGVAGMVAAYHLSREHDITVYESGEYPGGHTHTVDVQHGGRSFAIDTGFIVYNDWTYPNFIALLDELRVPWQPSQMSFSVRCEKSGLEYNGTTLNSLFAQRSNIARPSFLRMVADILRFNRQAPALLLPGSPDMSLGEYLGREKYSRYFIEHYIIPMGAAIWSSRPVDMLGFPARFFVEFFSNHGFLSVNDRPTWRVIEGGSREYVKRLTAPYAARIRLNTPVESVARQPNRVLLRMQGGSVEQFDRVFLACHSNQALQLLSDASHAERHITISRTVSVRTLLFHTKTSQQNCRHTIKAMEAA